MPLFLSLLGCLRKQLNLADCNPAWQPAIPVCAAQSGMLAQQDPWTPAALVALHVSTKLAGNLLLVTWLGMGLAGAAWASVASQWITAAAVSLAVCTKPVHACLPTYPCARHTPAR